MRDQLATNNQCDVTCPLSTSIFARICAQAAIEEMQEGKTESEVTPFWRLLSVKDKVVKKLAIDPDWIELQREIERTSIKQI